MAFPFTSLVKKCYYYSAFLFPTRIAEGPTHYVMIGYFCINPRSKNVQQVSLECYCPIKAQGVTTQLANYCTGGGATECRWVKKAAVLPAAVRFKQADKSVIKSRHPGSPL